MYELNFSKVSYSGSDPGGAGRGCKISRRVCRAGGGKSGGKRGKGKNASRTRKVAHRRNVQT